MESCTLKFLILIAKAMIYLHVCFLKTAKCETDIVNNMGGAGRIIGGIKATPGQFPWQVYLYNAQFRGACGATIISPCHLITAGHCVTNGGNGDADPLYYLEPYAGVNDIDLLKGDYEYDNEDDFSEIQAIPVEEIYAHPNWDPKTASYELVILKLSDTYTWTDKVRSIRYASHEDKLFNGDTVIASGWGTTELGTTSKDLLWTDLTVVDCDDEYYEGEDFFCVRNYTNNHHVCNGDSGGPIVCKDYYNEDYLCGFTSKGQIGCAGYTVLGRVNYYTEWIKEVLDLDSCIPEPHWY